eukprot:498964-Pleurochrysis_carterae.AAC.3
MAPLRHAATCLINRVEECVCARTRTDMEPLWAVQSVSIGTGAPAAKHGFAKEPESMRKCQRGRKRRPRQKDRQKAGR